MTSQDSVASPMPEASMTQEQFNAQMAKAMLDLADTIKRSNAILAAVQVVLMEQPGFNTARFSALVEEFMARPAAAAERLQQVNDAVLRSILEAASGSKH